MVHRAQSGHRPQSLRLVTWSYSRMCVTWTFTVFSVMKAIPARQPKTTCRVC
jgi:hypothetical protein